MQTRASFEGVGGGYRHSIHTLGYPGRQKCSPQNKTKAKPPIRLKIEGPSTFAHTNLTLHPPPHKNNNPNQNHNPTTQTQQNQLQTTIPKTKQTKPRHPPPNNPKPRQTPTPQNKPQNINQTTNKQQQNTQKQTHPNHNIPPKPTRTKPINKTNNPTKNQKHTPKNPPIQNSPTKTKTKPITIQNPMNNKIQTSHKNKKQKNQKTQNQTVPHKMSNPKTTLKRKHLLIAITSIGALLLITAISLWLYTDSIIQGHEQLLNNPNLTQQQRWAYEGSLQWWKTAKTTTYNPLSIILITIGLCAIEFAIIYAIVQHQ